MMMREVENAALMAALEAEIASNLTRDTNTEVNELPKEPEWKRHLKLRTRLSEWFGAATISCIIGIANWQTQRAIKEGRHYLMLWGAQHLPSDILRGHVMETAAKQSKVTVFKGTKNLTDGVITLRYKGLLPNEYYLTTIDAFSPELEKLRNLAILQQEGVIGDCFASKVQYELRPIPGLRKHKSQLLYSASTSPQHAGIFITWPHDETLTFKDRNYLAQYVKRVLDLPLKEVNDAVLQFKPPLATPVTPISSPLP